MSEKHQESQSPKADEPSTVETPSDEKFDVVKLSKMTGNRLKFNGHNPHLVRGPGPMHKAADVLHGWSDYLHHYAKPVELTKTDYLAAIKAAGSFKTHDAAIAPHRK